MSSYYEETESYFVDYAQALIDNYCIDLDDLISILKDRVDFEEYCDDPGCLVKNCKGDHE